VSDRHQLSFARLYAKHGVSTIPIRADGTKAPDGRVLPFVVELGTHSWVPFQKERADDAQLIAWFGNCEPRGLAVVAGAVSGNLLVPDFERVDLFETWRESVTPLLAEAGIDFADFPVVETPRPGRHVWLRTVEPPPGNEKLAERPATEEELKADPKAKRKTLIETRGEGGYVLAPGSPARCHKLDREYRFLNLGWLKHGNAPRIGPELLELLLNAARELDQMPVEAISEPAPKRAAAPHDGLRPGDIFNRRADFRDFLPRVGATLVSESNGVQRWLRPGKSEGWSATAGARRTADGVPLLIVFSTSWGSLEATSRDRPKGYTPFAAYTALMHNGDSHAATRDLAQQGYCEQPTRARAGTAKSGRADQPAAPPPAPERNGVAHGGVQEEEFREGDAFEGEFGTTPPPGDAPPAPPRERVFNPKLYTSAEFFSTRFEREFIVRKVLVNNQPAGVGGPKKALKSSVGIDLAVSIDTASPFLGRFEVPRRRNVLLLNAESGEATMQETALRVARARGVRAEELRIVWGTDIPRFNDLAHLEDVADIIRSANIEVALFDPSYIGLGGVGGQNGPQASSIFEMGEVYMRFGRTCLEAGATPIMFCHSKKARGNDPPDLDDLAYAGVAEYLRQWMLLSRRERYEGDGRHQLWLSVGGSAGHSFLGHLDIDEGTIDDDFHGRRWEVSVEPYREAQKAKKSDRDQQQQAGQDADEKAVLAVLDGLVAKAFVATKTRVRESSPISETRTDKALARLRLKGVVEEFTLKVDGGNGARQSATAYRRVDE
jgi:hypothetical protein